MVSQQQQELKKRNANKNCFRDQRPNTQSQNSIVAQDLEPCQSQLDSSQHVWQSSEGKILIIQPNVSVSTPQFKERFNRSLKSSENQLDNNNIALISSQQHLLDNFVPVLQTTGGSARSLTFSSCLEKKQLQYRLAQLKHITVPLNLHLNVEDLLSTQNLQCNDESCMCASIDPQFKIRCDSPFNLYSTGLKYSPLIHPDSNQTKQFFQQAENQSPCNKLTDKKLAFTTNPRPNSQCGNETSLKDFVFLRDSDNTCKVNEPIRPPPLIVKRSTSQLDRVVEIEPSEVMQEQPSETTALKLNLFRLHEVEQYSDEDQESRGKKKEEGESYQTMSKKFLKKKTYSSRSELNSYKCLQKKIKKNRKSQKFVNILAKANKNLSGEGSASPTIDEFSAKGIQVIEGAMRPESPSSSNQSEGEFSSQELSASEYNRNVKLRQFKSTMTANQVLAPSIKYQMRPSYISRNLSPPINTQLARSQRSQTKSMRETTKRKVTANIGSPTFKFGPPGLLSHDRSAGLCRSFSMRNLSIRHLGRRVSPPSAKCGKGQNYHDEPMSPKPHWHPTLLHFQSSKSLVESHPASRRTSFISEARSDMGNSSLLRRLQQTQAMPASLKVSAYKQMTLRIFHSLNFIKQLPSIALLEEENKIDFQFKKPGMKKLLIFDLDETLIHSKREDEELDGNHQLWQIYQEHREPDEWVEIVEPDNQELFTQGFYKRPYLTECLQLLNRYYEIAIFTAGYEWYANPIIDKIDPDGTLIQHRYFRQHTNQMNIKNQNLFVKDLSLFKNLDLNNVLFVDNAIVSFSVNLRNGIPIVDYTGQLRDTELLKIAHYVQSISGEDNLIEANERTFQLQKILQTDIESYIKYYSIDELSEYDETDFEDDGNTAGSSSGHLIDQQTKMLGNEEVNYEQYGNSPTESNAMSDNQSHKFKQHIQQIQSSNQQQQNLQPKLQMHNFTQEVNRFATQKTQFSRSIFADPIPETASDNSKLNTPTLIRNFSNDSISLKEISPRESGSNSVSLIGQTSQSNKLTNTSKSSSQRRGSLNSKIISEPVIAETSYSTLKQTLISSGSKRRTLKNYTGNRRMSPINNSNRKLQNSDRDGNMGGTPYHLDSEDEHNQNNNNSKVQILDKIITIQRKPTNQTNAVMPYEENPSPRIQLVNPKKEQLIYEQQEFEDLEYSSSGTQIQDQTPYSQQDKDPLSGSITEIQRQFTAQSQQSSQDTESQQKPPLVPLRHNTFGIHPSNHLYVKSFADEITLKVAHAHTQQDSNNQQWQYLFASPPPGPSRSRGLSSPKKSPVRNVTENPSSSYYKTKNYTEKKFSMILQKASRFTNNQKQQFQSQPVESGQQQNQSTFYQNETTPEAKATKHNYDFSTVVDGDKQEKRRIQRQMQSDMKAQINLFKGVQLYDVIKPPNWTVRKQSLMQRKGFYTDNQLAQNSGDSPNNLYKSPNVIRNIDYHLDELSKCFQRKNNSNSSSILTQVLSANKQYASRYCFATPKNTTQSKLQSINENTSDELKCIQLTPSDQNLQLRQTDQSSCSKQQQLQNKVEVTSFNNNDRVQSDDNQEQVIGESNRLILVDQTSSVQQQQCIYDFEASNWINDKANTETKNLKQQFSFSKMKTQETTQSKGNAYEDTKKKVELLSQKNKFFSSLKKDSHLIQQRQLSTKSNKQLSS